MTSTRNFGVALETLRKSADLTQAQLAEVAGVTQAAIHRYEKESRAPSTEVLSKLAEAFGVTVGFLQHAGRIEGAVAVDAHMRRQQTAKPTVWRRLEAHLNQYRIHVGLLYEEISLQADLRFPTFDPVDVSAGDAARLVRMQWRMPTGPVRNLVGWLESAGALIIAEDFETSRVDGLSQWVSDHPIVLINSSAPTDRQRLTLAHELGHLVLHSQDITPDVESEANQFAAEFLMPSETIRPQLRNLSLGVLQDLKREWGVSMQALIERAHGLGLLPAARRTSLHRAMSVHGWRTREPVSDELPRESPALAQNIARAMLARGLNRHEIAALAGWSNSAKNTVFIARERELRAVP